MDNIYKKDSSIYFMVEGCGQIKYNLTWGNGFITDRKVISELRISDPNLFFKSIINKPYNKRIIISPHVYGPTISKDNHGYKGEKLFNMLNTSFGHLAKKYPIIIGEFGSNFEDKRDIDHLDDLAKWLKVRFGKNVNWMYWAYNENSGDTGGIVYNNWQDINWKKITWLVNKMNLKPWYL
jgi:hypothetical protein